MRITARGQVTIPVEIRERAGFLPGTDGAFVLDGDSVRLLKAEPRGGKETRGERAVRLLPGSATRPLASTTDEVVRLLRGEPASSSSTATC